MAKWIKSLRPSPPPPRVVFIKPPHRRNPRRFAIVACAVVAASLPGDAITLVLETVPLYLLYEASILVALFAGRAQRAQAGKAAAPRGPQPRGGKDRAEPTGPR